MREGLPPLPRHWRNPKTDHRGYPVPFFVKWIDGVPDFRVVEEMARKRCIEDGLCWICGGILGTFSVFAIGPMCAVNRASSEPPSHRDCVLYAMRACPFILMPTAKRREANMPPDAVDPGGIALKRNPGVMLAWTVKGKRPQTYKVENTPTGPLCRIGEPTALEAWTKGRLASFPEVWASVHSGLPLLQAILDEQYPDVGGDPDADRIVASTWPRTAETGPAVARIAARTRRRVAQAQLDQEVKTAHALLLRMLPAHT